MDDYYSKEMNKKYMSYSQFKDFLECPVMAMAKINGEYTQEETESLLVGSYVDAWLDGGDELSKFINNHPEMFNSRTGELKVAFKKAEELCNIIKEDEYFYHRLKGGERQKVLFCNIAGVPFKCKLDCFHDGECIDDGKVLKDCKDVWNADKGCYESFIMGNRYDLQGSIYRTAVKQNFGGVSLPFVLDVVTKEKTPDKRMFRLSDEVLDTALQEVINCAPLFQKMKMGLIPVGDGCGKCDYCKKIKKMNKNMIEVI